MAVKNVVREGILHLESGETIPVGEERWWRWLAWQCPFRFVSEHGRFTARCQSMKYGDYWYAYCRRQQKLHKRYLGKDDSLTLAKMEQAAAELAGNVTANLPLDALPTNQNWDELAACIEETAVNHIQTGQATILLAQLAQIPTAIRLRYKPLALTYARLLLTDGQTRAAASWLKKVKETSSVVDRDLLAQVGRMEAILQSFVGRPVPMPAWTGLARESLDLRDLFLIAIVHWLNDDIDTTDALLLRLRHLAATRKDDYMSLLAASIRIGLAGLRCRITEAQQLAADVLQTITGPAPISIGAVYIMQGYTHFQQNDLEIARKKLENGVALMVDALWPSIAVFGLYVLAQIHWVRGEAGQAVAHLRRAMGMIYTQESISFWSVAQLQALQALLNLNLGDVEAARSWQKRYTAPPSSQIEAFVYGRVCLADGRYQMAKTVLTRLLVSVEQCPRLFTAVDVLLPLAAVYWRQANVREAAAALKHAVHQSQIQNCRRPFLDWAVELESLFQLVVLLPEMEENGRCFLQSIIPGSPSPAADQTILQRLAQLTGREQQLLEQIHAGVTNRQIADTFALAESTVKTHLRHVYQKLGVKNRKEAALLLADRRRLMENGRFPTIPRRPQPPQEPPGSTHRKSSAACP